MKRLGYKIIILSLLCIAASIGAAIYFSNIPKGVIHGIFFGLPFAFLFGLLTAMIERIVKPRLIGRVAYILIIAIAVISPMAFQWHWLSPSPTKIYEMVLYSRLPSAVNDLKGNCEHPGKDAIYRLRFNTDSAHFQDIFSEFHPKSQFLGLLNLDNKDSLTWWDNKRLGGLPVYKWIDDRWDRTLWYESQESAEQYTIYLSAIGAD